MVPAKKRKADAAGKAVVQLKWDDSKKVSKTTLNNGAQELDSAVKSIAKCNPDRAAIMISKLLNDKSNAELKDIVLKSITDDDLNSLIFGGIKESLAHHSKCGRGSRTSSEETFVKNVMSACLFKIVKENRKDISTGELASSIGISWQQAQTAREKAKDMIDNNKTASPLTREIRSDYMLTKLQPYVYAHLMCEDVTHFDSNQRLMEMKHPSTGDTVKVHRRVWLNANKRQQWLQFQASPNYAEFQKDHDNNKPLAYDTWRKVLEEVGKFVSNATPKSCVDEKMSGLEHAGDAILHALKLPDVKAELENNNFQGLTYEDTCQLLLKRSPQDVVKAVCCPAVDQPDLHIEGIEKCPKLIPFNCTHGECKRCGIKKKLGILKRLKNCQAANVEVPVRVWKDSPRQGVSAGKQNTQKTLLTQNMTIKSLTRHFKDLIETCTPHYQEICWLKQQIDADFATLRDDTILIFTDYAAVLALRASETKNSSVDAHAINDNFLVIISKRRKAVVKVKRKVEGQEVEVEDDVPVWRVDIKHMIGETMSKGKKNDWAFHNKCLDFIAKEYAKIFEEDPNSPPLRHIIVWSDNAPAQYRCRQNFLQVVSVAERHNGITITHRLAVVDNFKGVWDGLGKILADHIRKLEMITPPRHSETGYDVFRNCLGSKAEGGFEETQVAKWKRYEENKDAQLKTKGRYGMDSRKVYFVAETQAEFDRLAPLHPGRILLCDRSFVLDTYQQMPIKHTTELHEVSSVATEIPTEHPRRWPANVADLPCHCKYCVVNPGDDRCKYSVWCNRRVCYMQVECFRLRLVEVSQHQTPPPA